MVGDSLFSNNFCSPGDNRWSLIFYYVQAEIIIIILHVALSPGPFHVTVGWSGAKNCTIIELE